MGGHYGSVQVRSEDRERVKAVAEQIARDEGIHILISPPVNGWIALFPEVHGQDDAVGRAVAEQMDADVLHLLVHDDDVLAYWFYRDRQLVDSYWSRPGYFGEENRQREEGMVGNPQVFRPLIGDDVSQLAELLDRNYEVTSEYVRLEKLARLLKITNAVNAFEYLKQGERTGIKNWRQFIEVPVEQVASEAKLKRRKKNQGAAERKRLRAAGVLLLFEDRKNVPFLPCAAGGGLLVAWLDYPKRAVSFDWCGTIAGLRVYEWAAVPRRDGADMPAPMWRFELPNPPPGSIAHVQAVVEEVDVPAIVFGGSTGRIYRLDLTSGEIRELVTMGDNTVIGELTMSADGQALGAGTFNVQSLEGGASRNDDRRFWSVWNYPKLRGPFLREAGI